MTGPPSGLSIDDFSESEVESASGVSSDVKRVPAPGADVDGALKHPRFYDEDGSLILLVGSNSRDPSEVCTLSLTAIRG